MGEFIQILFVMLLVAAYVGAIAWFVVYPARYVLGVSLAVGVVAVIFLYLREFHREFFTGEGFVDEPQPPEPAYKQYFFRKAWRQYGRVVRQASIQTRGTSKIVHLWIKTFCYSSGAGWLTWPLGVVLHLALAGAVLAGALVYAFLGLLHIALLSFVASGSYLAAGFLRTLESVLMLWRRTFFSCPHSGCHQRFDLPWYYCKGCGARHERLVPGSYGVLWRRCSCGEQLPTSFLTGRHRLEAACPACGHPLHGAIGSMRRLDIPLVGGPSAGKSTYLVALTAALRGLVGSRFSEVDFPDGKHLRDFQEAERMLREQGQVRKTVDLSPHAFQTRLATRQGDQLLLSWYDPAGEVYSQGSEQNGQWYFLYHRAAIFLLDPFSIDRVRDLHAHRLQANFSAVRPSEVYDRAGWQSRDLQQNRRRKPLAVVLSKTDLCALEAEILATAPLPANGHSPTHPDSSNRIRAWLLAQGEGHLVELLETDFFPVRYFSCNAKATTTPGRHHILAPLLWLLTETKSLNGNHGE